MCTLGPIYYAPPLAGEMYTPDISSTDHDLDLSGRIYHRSVWSVWSSSCCRVGAAWPARYTVSTWYSTCFLGWICTTHILHKLKIVTAGSRNRKKNRLETPKTNISTQQYIGISRIIRGNTGGVPMILGQGAHGHTQKKKWPKCAIIRDPCRSYIFRHETTTILLLGRALALIISAINT